MQLVHSVDESQDSAQSQCSYFVPSGDDRHLRVFLGIHTSSLKIKPPQLPPISLLSLISLLSHLRTSLKNKDITKGILIIKGQFTRNNTPLINYLSYIANKSSEW